jgi:hypothetical protein
MRSSDMIQAALTWRWPSQSLPSFQTKEEAEREVERLQEINRHAGCRYFWTPTRYYPEGRGVQAPSS